MIKIVINSNENKFSLKYGGTIATVEAEFMQVVSQLYNSIKETNKDVAKNFMGDIKMFFQLYDFDKTAEENANKVKKIADEHICRCKQNKANKENKANTENKNTLRELDKLKNAIDKAIKDDLSPEEFLKEIIKAVNK